MKKTLILSLFSTLVFAHDSELSEYEKKALQELANSQIPHISYTPIKETMQEMDKKTETSGVCIQSADKSVTVKVKVTKETDAKGKDNEIASVSISKTFD